MFKLIVAGGREFNNKEYAFKVLDKLLSNKKDVQIVCGGARGADEIGRLYAISRGHSVKMFPAEWKLHGKSAGYKRNHDMAVYADALLAFWDNKSKGTGHMISIANSMEMPIRIKQY